MLGRGEQIRVGCARVATSAWGKHLRDHHLPWMVTASGMCARPATIVRKAHHLRFHALPERIRTKLDWLISPSANRALVGNTALCLGSPSQLPIVMPVSSVPETLLYQTREILPDTLAHWKITATLALCRNDHAVD